MKLRTVYGATERGRFIAREELRKAGPTAPYWATVSCVFEDEMLVPFPGQIEIGTEEGSRG